MPEENQTISIKTKKDFAVLLTTGIPFSLLQWYTIILWIATGNYLPFIIYVPIFIIYAIIISENYFKKVAYICPQCKEVFVLKYTQALLAIHTPKLRKLKCPYCGYNGICVEIKRKEAL